MPEDSNASCDKKALAILIDGDNASPGLIKEMLAEAGKYGRIILRRIYGDWTTPNMNSWKETLQSHALQPIQQFRYTTGKNATDSTLIIDAMDLLYSGSVQGFCLVSNDSDYTRLATRLRESGAFVMGIGRQSTPKAFTNGCDLFVFVENLRPTVAAPAPSPEEKTAAAPAAPLEEALSLLHEAFELRVQEDGWAHLAAIGGALRGLDPSFDHRTFGCSNLTALVRSFPGEIQTKELKTESGSAVLLMKFKKRNGAVRGRDLSEVLDPQPLTWSPGSQ